MALVIISLVFSNIWFAQSDCETIRATCENNCINAGGSQVNYNNCSQSCNNAYNFCLQSSNQTQSECENDWWIRENWVCNNNYQADSPQAYCEAQEQMIRQNGTCVNNYNADQADQLQACLAKCKDKDGKTSESCVCKCNWGIVLNTDFPFIGRCIDKSGNDKDGKSSLIGISSAFTNIMMTLILTAWFAMVIRGWVQIAMGQVKEGRQKIVNVVIAFAGLGSLGILLRLINPNFFK